MPVATIIHELGDEPSREHPRGEEMTVMLRLLDTVPAIVKSLSVHIHCCFPLMFFLETAELIFKEH